MTLAEVQSACNAKIGLLWPSFQVLQNGYFQKHGKYFQVLKNGGGIDGTETQFSIRTPVDEKYESDIDKSVALTVPCEVEVHEWQRNGDTEAGYMVILSLYFKGKQYRREMYSNGRDTGWGVYKPLSVR